MPGEGQTLVDQFRDQRGGGKRAGWWHGAGERERLILASNRGPIEYSFNGDGIPEARSAPGGVVSGLLCAVRQRPVTWIALAMTEADRLVARADLEAGTDRASGIAAPRHVPENLREVELKLVPIAPDAYHRHYNGISNRVLWFAQHYLLNPTQPGIFGKKTANDWEKGYLVANRAIADAVIAELRRYGMSTPVLFQDYQLYLAPDMVRAACPEARLAHFVHIPWPDARYWEMLPAYLVRSIFSGLAANDVVGFQTARDVRNFLQGAERYLPEARLEWEPAASGGALVWPARQARVRAFPIALAPDEVARCAGTRAARSEAERIQREITRGDEAHRLIVRVDRMEPTKNIVLGFHAYERLLKRHKEWHGRVTFLALLVPSRQEMREYRAYERQVRRVIERINARYGTLEWQPIVYVFENNRSRALALMRRYDVLLVNPVIDGMNLVVKEGGLLNERDGVIVLSRTAGAHDQLGQHVLGIHPMDVDQTADALYRALMMPQRRRKSQAAAVREVLLRESASDWLEAQLAVLPVPVAAAAALLADVLPEPAGVPAPAALALPAGGGRGEPVTPKSSHPFTRALSSRARGAVLSAEWPADSPAVLPASSESAPALSR
jgi:trehalose 6-phosphate synthase